MISGCSGRLSTEDDYTKSVSVSTDQLAKSNIRMSYDYRTRVRNELIPVQTGKE